MLQQHPAVTDPKGTVRDVRGFIPEGEEPTPEERVFMSRAAKTTAGAPLPVTPNFIPGPDDVPETRSREEIRAENERRAAEAAARWQERWTEFEYETASRKLSMLSARDAVEFVRTLSPALKAVYAQAELDGQARATVLKELKAFLPPERNKTGGPDAGS